MRGSWTTVLRRGVLERMYGDDARAEIALVEADSAAPGHQSYLLFGHILWKLYERRGTKADPFAAEFRCSLGAQPSAARVTPSSNSALPLICRARSRIRSRSGTPGTDGSARQLTNSSSVLTCQAHSPARCAHSSRPSLKRTVAIPCSVCMMSATIRLPSHQSNRAERR